MQAARRVLTSAGILSRRGMATAAQLAADASKPKGSLVDTLGVFTVTPIAVGVFVYDMFIAHEVGAVCSCSLRADRSRHASATVGSPSAVLPCLGLCQP